MSVIKMPSTPRSAYDPGRSPNALLLTHVRELEKAVIAAGRKVRRQTPKTEAQAAAYMQHLNRALYQQLLLPPMTRRALDVPLEGTRRARPRSKAKPRSQRRKTKSARQRKTSTSSKRTRGRRS
jgi:hypothetical protein